MSNIDARIIINGSIERVADEVSKCILLCANCHRMEHYDVD